METIDRHLDALRRLSREADDLKLQIEQEKITNGVTLDDVTIWSGDPVWMRVLWSRVNV